MGHESHHSDADRETWRSSCASSSRVPPAGSAPPSSPSLLSTGHEVLGLARSEASAERLTAAGGTVLRGDISDPDVLRAGAEQADGVMHLAFGHDFTDFAGAIAQEGAATRTLGEALVGTGKPLVIASGTPAVPGQVTTEETVANEGTAGGRGVNAQHVIGLAEQGVRSAVVRLPRSVHQAGVAFGFAGFLINAARRTGVSGFVGDGSQRWPAVHRLDAAHLFCLALEKAEPGTVLHAVGDEGDTMRSVADEIGRHRAARRAGAGREPSGSSARSSASTSRRAPPSPASASAGRPRTRACWPTWRRVTTRPDQGRQIGIPAG